MGLKMLKDACALPLRRGGSYLPKRSSEPRVPFRGRPPELLARASLGPAPIPKPRTDEMFEVTQAKLEELPEEDDPLCTAPPLYDEPPGRSTSGFAGSETKVPANDRPPDLVRALGDSKLCSFLLAKELLVLKE